MYIAVSSMVLQSYTIFSVRNPSTILFLHHSWSIGTNTKYWWGFFLWWVVPLHPVMSTHSRCGKVSFGRTKDRGHLFLPSAFATEDPRISGNPHLRQLQAGQHHTAECAWVNWNPKAYIQQQNYSAFGLSLAYMKHSLQIPSLIAKRAISGISALIDLYVIALFSGVMSAIRTAYGHQGVLCFLRNRNGPILYILHGQTHLTLVLYKPGKSLTWLFVCK